MDWTLKQICEKQNVSYSGNGQLSLHRVCGLNNLIPGGIVYITNPDDLTKVLDNKGVAFRKVAVIVPFGVENSKYNLIFSSDPLKLHTEITTILHPPPKKSESIHPSAVIGENVVLGKSVTIDANVVLYDNVTIGDHSIIRAGVVIMENSTIGHNCLIYPNVTIRENCHLKNRVIVQGGTSIGSDGYGFFQRDGKHYKIPQIGGVILENDVEIGGCCAIDRSKFYNTIIGEGTKLDNLVHIAHNVEIGEHSLLTAQVGIAGSTKIGHHLRMGGQSGIANNVEVGNEVTLLSRALITKSTNDKSIIGGFPGRPAKKWIHAQALFNRIGTLFERLKRLEDLIDKHLSSKT